MDIRYFKPLYEFGALLRYLEENGMTKEALRLHTEMNDLSRIYYKVVNNLSEDQRIIFNKGVDRTYQNFVESMD